MSDDHDLGPMPEPEIEPAEPNPGGPDARPDPAEDGDVVPADLSLEDNPAVDETSTPALGEGEDTSTTATEDESGESAGGGPDHESPA